MIVALDARRRLIVPPALAPASPGDYFDAHFDPGDRLARHGTLIRMNPLAETDKVV